MTRGIRIGRPNDSVPMGLLSLFLVGTLVSEPSGAEEERQKLLSKVMRRAQ
jgi:DHA2 family multidrug resistance protein